MYILYELTGVKKRIVSNYNYLSSKVICKYLIFRKNSTHNNKDISVFDAKKKIFFPPNAISG